MNGDPFFKKNICIYSHKLEFQDFFIEHENNIFN